MQNNYNWITNSEDSSIWLFSTAKLQLPDKRHQEIWLSETAKLEKWATPANKLFYCLNYTILSYLSTIDDPLKRAFYEQETIRGCWTQKELDRQVSSQYYERMGLSKDKKKLQQLVAKNAQQITPTKDYRKIFSLQSTVCNFHQKMKSESICWRI